MEYNPLKLNIEFLEELLLLNNNDDSIDLKSEIINTLDVLPKDHAQKSFFISSRRYLRILKKEHLERKNRIIKNLNKDITYVKNNPYDGGTERINNHKRDLKTVKSKSYKISKSLDFFEPEKTINISMNEIEEIEELCNTIEKEINNIPPPKNNSKTLKEIFRDSTKYDSFIDELIEKGIVKKEGGKLSFLSTKENLHLTPIRYHCAFGMHLYLENFLKSGIKSVDIYSALNTTFNLSLNKSNYNSLKRDIDNAKTKDYFKPFFFIKQSLL
jgi:hypothetical protein